MWKFTLNKWKKQCFSADYSLQEWRKKQSHGMVVYVYIMTIAKNWIHLLFVVVLGFVWALKILAKMTSIGLVTISAFRNSFAAFSSLHIFIVLFKKTKKKYIRIYSFFVFVKVFVPLIVLLITKKKKKTIKLTIMWPENHLPSSAWTRKQLKAAIQQPSYIYSKQNKTPQSQRWFWNIIFIIYISTILILFFSIL